MISKCKKYFTFFGILAATADTKMHSFFSMIESIITKNIPKITRLLLSKVLKPIKLYSTNNI
ncbi:hypothetical protein GCM10012288_09590 [Malaciobacter pacificus]|jgi:hypothetical protein|uniref:Uncharacterized protein n=1 Tax=Malaciobacter pacificus TaxID=1080223 RepID=A0A5C2H6Z6_9BACT|nr:hypothetical protein [Malaciobacter pacificus]QEP34593.1 hypothetical protein APAC_1484 [Malaciobacter pacificus]GGD37562.1 hypothetical protein GCM10012288_09590 [Malaciobacter pacificus]